MRREFFFTYFHTVRIIYHPFYQSSDNISHFTINYYIYIGETVEEFSKTFTITLFNIYN